MQNCRTGGNFHRKTQREKKREIDREQQTMDNHFDSLVLEFQYVLFWRDVTNVDVFGAYNRRWILYADEWNRDNRKILKCDTERFSKYAIEHWTHAE